MRSTYVLYIFFTIFYLTIYLFILKINYNSQNKFMLFKKKIICLIIYSLNLALCLHLAISSFLLFNNSLGSGKSKMWIFSSRHRLHLLSKDFGVLDLFSMDHWMSGVNPLFFNPQ